MYIIIEALGSDNFLQIFIISETTLWFVQSLKLLFS